MYPFDIANFQSMKTNYSRHFLPRINLKAYVGISLILGINLRNQLIVYFCKMLYLPNNVQK